MTPAPKEWGDWLTGPWVVGIDPSLQATGIAYADGSAATIDTKELRGTDRLITVRRAVLDALDVADGAPDLVVIEGYSYASKGRSIVDLGELGGIIRATLADACAESTGMDWLVIPPATLKKYATGKGTADKTGMVVAARERLHWEGMSHDQADAVWLRAAGLDLLDAPLCELPKTHRSALGAYDLLSKQPERFER